MSEAATLSDDDETVQSEMSDLDTDGAKWKVSNWSNLTLVLGPVVSLLLYLILDWISPEGMTPEAMRVLSVAVWIAIWWMTEAVHLGVTSMIPLAFFPMFGIIPNKEVAKSYSSNLFWLFFGGIQLSIAIERCGLHRRIALAIIRAMGTRVALLQLGLNLAVASLSMFLSNTSTTLMLLPVATALLASLESGNLGVELKKPLMLGLAYSANVGGIGTIVGTGTNGVLVAIAGDFDIDMSFAQWSLFALPFSVISVLAIWAFFVVAYRIPFVPLPSDHPIFEQLQSGHGPIAQSETRVGLIFACTVLAWMTRSSVEAFFCLSEGFWSDDVIAIAMVISLFIIKAEHSGGEVKALMDWESLLKMPWHLFFLFGAGLALAAGFKQTGLSLWIGEQLSFVKHLPPCLTIAVICLSTTFLTEVTSNVATAGIWLPIVGNMAVAMGRSPLFLMVPCAMSASCAFCLPVATPPNAVVFGSGHITIRDMARNGVVLSLTGVLLVTAWVMSWGSLIFDNWAPPAPAHLQVIETTCTAYFGWFT